MLKHISLLLPPGFCTLFLSPRPALPPQLWHPTYTPLRDTLPTVMSRPQTTTMETSLPTPPTEDNHKSFAARKPHSSSKSVKAVHKSPKRASAHSHPSPPAHDSPLSHSVSDGRHKRVWKACERCRMKKTKVWCHWLLWSSRLRCPWALSLTPKSATESSLARGVRTTVLSARQGLGKRRNTSNYQEGMSVIWP